MFGCSEEFENERVGFQSEAAYQLVMEEGIIRINS